MIDHWWNLQPSCKSNEFPGRLGGVRVCVEYPRVGDAVQRIRTGCRVEENERGRRCIWRTCTVPFLAAVIFFLGWLIMIFFTSHFTFRRYSLWSWPSLFFLFVFFPNKCSTLLIKSVLPVAPHLCQIRSQSQVSS